MAKKKKIAETQATAVDSLKYQGTVKVSILKGKKVLSSKTYHNTGYISLFKFLCNCLAENYDSTTRPCRIVFYGGDDLESLITPDLTKTKLVTSIAVLANTAEVVKKVTETAIEYYTTTYHFLIPFAYIKGTGETVKLYKAGLLKENANLGYDDYKNELCASYNFTDEAGKTWEPIEISKVSSENFSIAIDWELSFKN